MCVSTTCAPGKTSRRKAGRQTGSATGDTLPLVRYAGDLTCPGGLMSFAAFARRSRPVEGAALLPLWCGRSQGSSRVDVTRYPLGTFSIMIPPLIAHDPPRTTDRPGAVQPECHQQTKLPQHVGEHREQGWV